MHKKTSLKFSEIGVQDSLSNDRKNKVRLLNVFSIIAFGVFFLSGLTNLYINDPFSGILLICFSIFTLFTIVFNYINLNKIAISYLFLIISFGIFYFDSYSGIESGSYLYYFPLFLGIANLFDFRTKRDKQIVFIQTSIIILLATINVLTDYQLFKSDFLNQEQVEIMFKSNLLLTLLSISYFIYIIIRSNIRKVELLEELIIEENKLNLLERDKTKEKEILLAELQHRLKNNLSVISSLIKLKGENASSTDFQFIQQESWHAIQSIALAHNLQQYRNNGFYVSIDKFSQEIANNINFNEDNNYQKPNIILESRTEETIQIKQAIPFGLLIHECIYLHFYNSFNTNPSAELQIQITETKNSIAITFKSTIEHLFESKNRRNELLNSFIEQLDANSVSFDTNSLKCTFQLIKNQPEIESRKIYE